MYITLVVAHEGACALVRHAFHCHYSELTTSDTNVDKKYKPERAYLNTLKSYKRAILDFLERDRIARLKCLYNGKPTPKRKKHIAQIINPLIGSFDQATGRSRLNSTLDDLIEEAKNQCNP